MQAKAIIVLNEINSYNLYPHAYERLCICHIISAFLIFLQDTLPLLNMIYISSHMPPIPKRKCDKKQTPPIIN